MNRDYTDSNKSNPASQQPSTASPRPMTPKETAAFLGLDNVTVIRWARSSYLPAHPMGEGRRKFWRFFEHEILDWLYGQSNEEERAA